MRAKMNIVVAGDSSFCWDLVKLLKDEIEGRLYFLVLDHDMALEASMMENVIVVEGSMTDLNILQQLELEHCDTFIAGAKEERSNVLCALYARNAGAKKVYARVFETDLDQLLESVGIIPVLTAKTAAAFSAIQILQPSVAELVSLTTGTFGMIQIDAAEVPEVIGHQLGNLDGEDLNIVALDQGGQVKLSYKSIVTEDSKLLVIYDTRIKDHLKREIKKIAKAANGYRNESQG
jgi:trk system potassium uptake protein TrkA